MSILKRLQGNEGAQPPVPVGKDTRPNAAVQTRRITAPTTSSAQDTYLDLKTRVQNKLLSGLDPSTDVTKVNEVRHTILELFEQILAEENIVLSRPERARLFEQIAAEILGFGPIQPLLEDDQITEIMVNGAKSIYIERRGKIHRVPVSFESTDHVLRLFDRIVAPFGRAIE